MNAEKCSLKDKVALVTGASRGIGRAIALGLAEAGANVAICARKAPALEQTAGEIEALGVKSLAVPANVRKSDELANLVDKTLAKFGKIDILVNNAGTNVFVGGIADIEESAWDVIMNTNVKACFLLSQLVGKHMIERKEGVIVNVSSIGGVKSSPMMGVYSVSKAALIMLTKVLAAEWGQFGIRANCIAPGMVKTGFSQPFWGNDEVLPQILRDVPLDRLAEPEEMASAVVFLASDAASYISAQTIVLDGGASA